MSTRICVFKDCNNYYSRIENSDVTIFSFPKDPKRAEQWRLLGQVHPNITNRQLFMCSKHFDAKYLSITKNRTILLGEAVPNAYESTENLVAVDNVNHNQETSPSSSTAQSFYIDLDDDQLNVENVIIVESSKSNEMDQVKQCEFLGNHDKRIASELNISTVGVSIVSPSRNRAYSPSLSLPDSSDDCMEEDVEQLIDASEVSLFKMRNEEYVQMTREYYLREKRQMMNQLRAYKQILRSFKTQLVSLEDL
ncbi:uncharacterized protein LOC117791232 [Drosophila innubila]|uniref:uncharacterized protein LOC117791232 n=1 Tax=Drosophila innubila TaxID=198719 RepID=UPI00148B6494|nr:uncharacterized protein LOC117791232 [Drosophila innubila]